MATQDMLEFAIVLDHAVNPDRSGAVPIVRTFGVAELASKLIRAAGSLHKRYEAACSYPWASTEAYETATARKEIAVAMLMKPFGIDVEFQRDPRGAAIKLKLPSGRTNDWGGEGYCVPTKAGV